MVTLVRSLLPVFLLTLPLSGPAAQVVADPGPVAVRGAWDGPWDWSDQIDYHTCAQSNEMAHAAVIATGLHQGKVLLWNFYTSEPGCTPTGGTSRVWLFDPQSPQDLVEIPCELGSNIFCSGKSFDPSGNLIVAGGFPFGPGTSPPDETYRFQPRALGAVCPPPNCGPYPVIQANCSALWAPLGTMAIGRYYPTLVTLNRASFAYTCWTATSSYTESLTGGAAFILGGPSSITYEGNEFWELLPAGASSWLCPLVPSNPPAPPPGLSYHAVPSTRGEYDVLSPAPVVLFDSYPRTIQRSDGKLFTAFDIHTDKSAGTTPSGATWEISPPHVSGASSEWEIGRGPEAGAVFGDAQAERYYGTAVLRHELTSTDRFIIFGGLKPTGTATCSGGSPVCEWVPNEKVQEYNMVTNTWASKATDLHYPRVNLNGVALPTGEILIVGGNQADDKGPSCCLLMAGGYLPVSQPELYDPGLSPQASGTSQALAWSNPAPTKDGLSMAPTPRMYHHIAVLLPDGRVFVAGGEDTHSLDYAESEYTGEIFNPPYLYQGFRPTILSAPSQISFATSFELDVDTSGGTIDRVVLLRPASVTHHFDTDQRYIELAFSSQPIQQGEKLTVIGLGDTLGPPGYYMLFVVENDGGVRVPSIAEFVQVQ